MQTTWLHRSNQQECLVFFSGWGMDPEPFGFLPATGLDLYLVHDYRELTPLDLQPFAAYRRLHLLAWSMGVWTAAHLLAEAAACFVSRIALAGTLSPIDARLGLPPDSYAAMIDGFDQQVLDTFYRNMFDHTAHLDRFLASRPRRPMADLRDEMVAFRDTVLAAGPASDLYTRKIVTSRDRIFAGRNQLRAWGKEAATVRNWPHFPFFLLTDWRNLLSV